MSSATTRSCRYVGQVPNTLDDGRPLVAGDTVDVDLSTPHNAWLLESGRLIALDEESPPTLKDLKAEASELDIPGRSSMDADELRQAIAEARDTTKEED